jgi:hypothetical protein
MTPNHASTTTDNIATKKGINHFGKLGKPMTRGYGTPCSIPDGEHSDRAIVPDAKRILCLGK